MNKKLPADIYSWKINARYAPGVPDCWYSGVSDLWVEWKYIPKITKSVLPKLSALQKSWLQGRYEEGRNVAVIVGSPEGSLIFEEGEWANKKGAEGNLLTKPELVDWLTSKIGSKKHAYQTVQRTQQCG